MSEPITKMSQAFYIYKTKKTRTLLFWSEDWKTLRPWTYDGGSLFYVDRRVETREVGVMTSYFIGPLLLIHYRAK